MKHYFNIRNRFTIWRYLTNVWSVILYLLFIADFIKDNAYKIYIGPMAAIYVGTLAIYASDKEFERWHKLNGHGRHPGELFVIMWTILIFFVLFASFLLSKHYELPGEITSSYIAVLSILAITQKSKDLYKKKKH